MLPHPDQCATTPPPAEASATAPHVGTSSAGLLLSSDVLLAGKSAVTIEHQGVHYVLRATRSGKLILTK